MLEFESYDGISIPSCRFENGEFPNSYFEEIGFFFFFSFEDFSKWRDQLGLFKLSP
jgi:hypothetical protein